MIQKNVYMIGGPNGSGKTTVSMLMLNKFLAVSEFVNADNIASGLSPLNPDSVAITAGKLMIKRIKNLIKDGKSFAFETICAGKNHIHTLNDCKKAGYKTNLLFLWLPDANIAVDWVAGRVKQGGHFIPREVILRRYHTGLRNLLSSYLPLCDNAMIFDNSKKTINGYLSADLIALKENNKLEIIDKDKWIKIQEHL